MSNPLPSATHVDRLLTNFSVAYLQDAKEFVATRVFPFIPVDKKSDLYLTYDLGDIARDDMHVRANGDETMGIDWNVSSGDFECENYGLHKDLTDRDYANADEPLELEKYTTELLTQKALIKLEREFMTNFFTTSIWSDDIEGNTSGSNTDGTDVIYWSDHTNAQLAHDVEYWQRVIKGNTGKTPNTLVVSPLIWGHIKEHAKIIEQVKYTQTGKITPGLVASLCNLDNVLVMGGVYNSAAKGATDSLGFINTTDDALLCYVDPNPAKMKPTAGVTFGWNYNNRFKGPYAISKFYIDAREANRIEANMSFDQELVSAQLGVFFDDLIA